MFDQQLESADRWMLVVPLGSAMDGVLAELPALGVAEAKQRVRLLVEFLANMACGPRATDIAIARNGHKVQYMSICNTDGDVAAFFYVVHDDIKVITLESAVFYNSPDPHPPGVKQRVFYSSGFLVPGTIRTLLTLPTPSLNCSFHNQIFVGGGMAGIEFHSDNIWVCDVSVVLVNIDQKVYGLDWFSMPSVPSNRSSINPVPLFNPEAPPVNELAVLDCIILCNEREPHSDEGGSDFSKKVPLHISTVKDGNLFTPLAYLANNRHGWNTEIVDCVTEDHADQLKNEGKWIARQRNTSLYRLKQELVCTSSINYFRSTVPVIERFSMALSWCQTLTCDSRIEDGKARVPEIPDPARNQCQIVSQQSRRRDDKIGMRECVPRLAVIFDQQTPFEHDILVDGQYALIEHRTHFAAQPVDELGAVRRIRNELETKVAPGGQRDDADEQEIEQLLGDEGGDFQLWFRAALLREDIRVEKPSCHEATSRAGIGTMSLSYKVDIAGCVGLTTTTAPTAAVIVNSSQQVGGGTSSMATGVKEAITGPVQVTGTGTEFCSASQVGGIRYNPTGNYFELCSYP